MLVGAFYNISGLKNQHLAADGFLPAIFAFSSKASEMHMLSICCFIIAIFPTFSILPKFSIGFWV
jgi:hypothetical protein